MSPLIAMQVNLKLILNQGKLVENLVEISGRSQLYDLEESSPNALKSDESTNKNGIVKQRNRT